MLILVSRYFPIVKFIYDFYKSLIIKLQEIFIFICSVQDKVTNEEQIAADVRNLIIRYRDTKFTGRAVARIFHGIQSPNYPALIWSKCRFWRVHIAANFNVICKIATREILALR